MAKFRFDEIAENLNEKRMPLPEDSELYIGLEHMDSGSLEITRWGSEVALTGQKLVMHRGDILFGRRNTYLKRVAIAPHDGLFSAHGMIWRPKEKVIDKDFFPFFIASDYFMDAAIRISVGSLSPTINWRDLKELEFELPDMAKQKELAKLFWAMERTKTAYKNLIAQTDELVKSQFVEMFGTPVDNRFGFIVTTLKEIAVKPLSYGATASAVDYDGNTRYVRITDITDDGGLNDDIKSASKGDDKYLLSEGDILFARTGATVGKTCRYRERYGRAIFAGFLIRLVPDQSKVFPDYLFHFTKSDYYLDFVKSAQRVVAQPNINAQEYGDLQILLPPLDKQEEFVKFSEQSDKSKFAAKQALEDLNAAQKALMRQYLG